MSFARIRARLIPSALQRRHLYSRINRLPAGTQRDELLIMAQRAESH
ncbi:MULTISPECIES: hypothetical protein [unclassified Gordonia (in: high G+C Gram-positive bacteria)]